jgi:peptide/nickel transport system permease protein
LNRAVVLFKHALRPALIPVLSEAGLQFGWLLGGTVLVEIIFTWPGIGRYAFTAIQYHDLQAIMGVALVLTFFKVMANLAVDILYAVADPRIQY